MDSVYCANLVSKFESSHPAHSLIDDHIPLACSCKQLHKFSQPVLSQLVRLLISLQCFVSMMGQTV